MRHITGKLIYLNQKQTEALLGDHTEPRDIEFFDGIPASAFYAQGHEGLYIVLHTDDEETH